MSFPVKSIGALEKAIRQTEESSDCVKEVQYLCKQNCHILQPLCISSTSFGMDQVQVLSLYCLLAIFLEEQNLSIEHINFREQHIFLANLNYWQQSSK